MDYPPLPRVPPVWKGSQAVNGIQILICPGVSWGTGTHPTFPSRPVVTLTSSLIQHLAWAMALVLGSWVVHKGTAKHAGPDVDGRTKTDLPEALFPPGPHPLGRLFGQQAPSFPHVRVCPRGSCLVICLIGRLGELVSGAPARFPPCLPLPLPAVGTFEIPEDFEERIEQQSIGSTTRRLTQTDFPLQAYEPKVQVPFQVLPGQCPRKIEIERYGWVDCREGLSSGRGHLPNSKVEGLKTIR